MREKDHLGSPDGQQKIPLALVGGAPVSEIPSDLYIPPDALEVILEAFEGPLDLLLYLIRRQNLDILEIKVADITKQYMDYIGFMEELKFELAAEYLLMAAVLTEVKSRMLLPRHEEEEEVDDDPRAELIRKLQEYERFKQAALDLNAIARMNRDIWVAKAPITLEDKPRPIPQLQLQEILLALASVLKRAENFSSHHIALEPLSTRERMSDILEKVSKAGGQFVLFASLFSLEEGKAGVVVTFIAILELIKESDLQVIQTGPYAPIHVKISSGRVIDNE
ncbi:MAG: segregation and condensation protein A [Candidatus Azotimanducaceae bacterium]|uniref:Segregation and condensation protein A n=1 Tax=OM182 bacterium TaxID=2510334 RepID=A0A520S185_9GAMM|nr:segregation/condensation protein A [Gammaproteobacteria bacterium]OUV68790.1 MAG: segregation/condensation protein A [Gammaproteobacteria bacterium TMED133]RZO76226.1 MAG: segregation/condensation protein A [OM182 bacterium]